MALVAKCWMRLVARAGGAASQPLLHRLSISRYYHTPVYEAKVGIPEFLKAVGSGVDAHIPKLEAEIGDFQKLLVTRTLRLKKLGIPCKHRKLILRYTHKYRLGLWKPRADVLKQ
ncbi:hypothetical protein Cni_G27177 [Canna indica]|uniref:Small ribosomal subunit protein mS41 SAM domain-containing protein n=1 Tax=Canna indica TaxID=4628 RepID=A0AAQ3L3E0_9LILI|nr:hypothetical protein Cni_G27177 [Canna indica]